MCRHAKIGAREHETSITPRPPVTSITRVATLGTKIQDGTECNRNHKAVRRRSTFKTLAASESASGRQSPRSRGFTASQGALVLTVLVTGIVNRILYKMVLQPLGNYVFFLAQLQTFSYVLVYMTILFFRKRMGLVTSQMLQATEKQRFAFIGACEALSQVVGFLCASRLPGVVLPLLSQSMMFWQIALGRVVLNKRLKQAELVGAAAVVGGVVCAAWPSHAGGSILAQTNPIYTVLFMASLFFPAVSTILKQDIFERAKAKLGGQQLDIFVVNTFSSLAQAGFVFLLLPVLSSLRGIPLSGLPDYLLQGWTCLRGGAPTCCSDCAGAPQLAGLYIATNLAFNISILSLLRSTGNIAVSLTMSSIVPMTIWAFTLPLPFLDAAPVLGANFAGGVVILFLGLLIYNSPTWLPALQKNGSPLIKAPE
ncbi:hypothetical protein WJX73_001036 [Symbiochloris irregularis]|uniref:Uncharacterized protein n=1 Tax=Symbiochloris irregularis TaxID=706552 RepID=A0AAW1NM81_9CHLO